MFRSSSGPGLSINTSSANLFSSKPTGSLFAGATTTSQPQQTSSLFGGTSTTSQAQQGSSLFANTSQPQQAPSLFGSPATASQPLQNSSIFGGNTTATKPQQGSSLFGGQTQTNNNQQQQSGGLLAPQQAQQTTPSLFGGNAAQSSQPQQAGGLFGSLGQNQPQQSQGNSIFGGGLNTQTKTSLFGAPQTSSQTQQATQHAPQPVSIFSSTIGQQSQQYQTIPGVRISVNELRPTTRFNDLHEELQRAIEYVDNFILNKINWQEQCEAANYRINDMCNEIPPDVEYCTKALDIAQRALESDASFISSGKDLVKADAADAKLSFKVIQNLKLPQQFHHTTLWSTVSAPQNSGPTFSDEPLESGASRNLVDYFSKQADDMAKSLESYKRNLANVEVYLEGIESNTMQQMQHQMFTRGRDGHEKNAEDQVRELAAVLREFENGILGVASRVGQVASLVSEL